MLIFNIASQIHCYYGTRKFITVFKKIDIGPYPALVEPSESILILWSGLPSVLHCDSRLTFCMHLRGRIQKFPYWTPGARTANGTALCHWVQLYRYFVSQSSEFCCHSPLCCFSTSVCCCCLFRYRLSPETFGYTLVFHLRAGTTQWYSAELRAGWSGVRVPVGFVNFFPHHRVRTVAEAHLTSYPMVIRGSFPGGKADHSPPSSAEVKNACSYIYIPPKCLAQCFTVFLEKRTVAQTKKKLSAFYGTWRFITVYIKFRHWSIF
jgi:hypothetical protein